MTRKLIINFFKDRINIIVLFIFNTASLLIFFNMEEGTRKEVCYPLVLSAFFLLVLLMTEWFKYYRFNYNLQRIQENFNIDLKPVTVEQKEINRIKAIVYKRQATEICNINNQNKKNSYFLSQWIHNLKTPIAIINIIAEKCSFEGKDPYLAIENIKLENNKLYNSIEQMLTIIRLEDFEKDYTPEPVNLISMLKKLLNNRKRQFILNGVLPVLKCEDENMLVLSDRKWNELMIEQIISNAIKYSKTDEQEKKIYINITRNGDKTELSIKDEGVGIPAYDIERVFEPFFTGENGRVYRESTGIGLYVCSEIARMLGHELKIESEVNMGTEVIVKYITKL